MSRRIKMFVGGICNLIVLVTFALILVVLSENRIVHVLAATVSQGSLSELGSNQVVLSTQDGSFVGRKELVKEDDPNEIPRSFFSFRGVPYASPPIGELRWSPPVPVELKSTPHLASDFKPPCSQWSSIRKKVIGNPDCLYLNIYTNYIPSTNKRRISSNITSWTVENPNLLPVLVYVHSGESISGSGSRYSPDVFMKERVVLVTFNYRLGALGYLSWDEVSGNYGLMDQIAALEWINKYIYRFGGNPLRVTIFGSVEYLLLANTTTITHQQLFHAAILKPQSTSILSPFEKINTREGAKNYLKHLADSVGCSWKASEGNDTNASLIDCLRKVDTDTLIKSQTKLQTFHNLPFPDTKANPLGPVVDNILLTDEPENLFNLGKFHDVPLMVGISVNEGFNVLLEFYLKLYQKTMKSNSDASAAAENQEMKQNLTGILTENAINEMLHSILRTTMTATPDIEKNGAFERVFQSIWDYYFGNIDSKVWSQEIEQVVQKLLRLFGDMFVNTGHCKLLHALAVNAKAPVYSYVFNYGLNHFPNFFKMTREVYENSEGIATGSKRPKRSLHTSLETPWDETYYLFYPIKEEDKFSNVTFSHIELSEGDKKMTNDLIKIWTTFAKNSRPVMSDILDHHKWMKIEPEHSSLNYYMISNSPLQTGMRSDFRKAECNFWIRAVPQVSTLSKAIHELEPFPILFWSSIAVVVLFAFIILTLIVLIVCVKNKTGSYGGDAIYLQSRGL